MSKKKKKLSKEAQTLNDKLLQLSKTTKTKPKIIKSVDTIQFVSPNASIYKNSATIILKRKNTEHRIDKKKELKLIQFLKRAPISFDNDSE